METAKVYESELSYPKAAPSGRFLLDRLSERVPARFVLYMLSWSGFLVSFMMRTDINLAIVAMVAEPSRPNISLSLADGEERYCHVPTTTVDDDNDDYGGTLDWSANVQSVVLASFYWAYIVSQIVGGWATHKLGTKRVFGYAQLTTALCSLAIPAAADTHHRLVIALRSVQGFASGLTWPAMYALVGHWIPTAERSRFMSSFQGFTIGIGVTYPLCGVLIERLGWRAVFYTTGGIGALWCIAWYVLAFDSPAIHPRISLHERHFIETHTDSTYETARTQPVPWRSILTSPPCWAIGITTFGRIWLHYTFIVPGPQYMRTVLGFSIETNGILSGAPFICSYLASVVFCYVADQLLLRGWMSLTNVRKLFTALAQVVPGVLVLLIPHLGCAFVPILAVWFIAVTMITAAYAGAMANIVDIAPNFAGPVLAFAQTIHMSASFLSPQVALYITRDGHTLHAWRTVFYVTAAVAIGTYVVYQIFGTGERQPWNNAAPPVAEQEELMLDRDVSSSVEHSPAKVPPDV